MSTPHILVVALALLAVVAALWMPFRRHGRLQWPPLAGLALIVIIGGMVMGGNHSWAYALIAVGAALAIIDIVLKARQGRP
jgi:membrane-bound ClpP family serine protease